GGARQPLSDGEVSAVPAGAAGGVGRRTRGLKIASMSESDVEQAVAPLYKTFTNPATTILSNPGHVELHLTAEGRSAEECEACIEELARGMRERLPGRIYSEDGRDLAAVVGTVLRE